MINLNSQLCDELDLIYWQLNTTETKASLAISAAEKDLLGKILQAKGIQLTDEILEVQPQGVVVVNLANHQLIFNDVDLADTSNIINLAKISDMLKDTTYKKKTWFKLKKTTL